MDPYIELDFKKFELKNISQTCQVTPGLWLFTKMLSSRRITPHPVLARINVLPLCDIKRVDTEIIAVTILNSPIVIKYLDPIGQRWIPQHLCTRWLNQELGSTSQVKHQVRT